MLPLTAIRYAKNVLASKIAELRTVAEIDKTVLQDFLAKKRADNATLSAYRNLCDMSAHNLSTIVTMIDEFVDEISRHESLVNENAQLREVVRQAEALIKR